MSDGITEAFRSTHRKQTLIFNIFGGPGSGKSILCANIFSELKWNHISAEMALEYVKDEVWEQNENAISNQLFIFGNQHQRLYRLLSKVDVIIVDSPLLLSITYDKEKNKTFEKYVVEKFNKYRNLNIFLERNSVEYEQKGRMQNLHQAIEKDNEILYLLNKYNIEYTSISMKKESVNKLVKIIEDKLNS